MRMCEYASLLGTIVDKCVGCGKVKVLGINPIMQHPCKSPKPKVKKEKKPKVPGAIKAKPKTTLDMAAIEKAIRDELIAAQQRS